MTTLQIEEIKATKKELKAMLRRTRYKVYCNLRRVSRDGMNRVISFHLAGEDGIIDITWHINKCLVDSKGKAWYSIDKTDYGLRVGGCGMDMGFSVVYNLSKFLYGSKREEGQQDSTGPYKLDHVWI